MRAQLTIVLMLGFAGAAGAQPAAPLAGAVPELPHIGLPLPSIGLPLPSIGLPPPQGPQGPQALHATPGRLQDAHQQRRLDSGQRGFHRAATVGTTIYLVPSYFVPISTSPTGEAFPEAVPDGGRLRVDVEPAGVGQVYLDGYYVGSSDDFNHAMDIASGRHTIEIRADGYQALQDDIAVAPGRLVTYRGVLTRSEPASAPPPAAEPAIAAPTGPTTFYVIPGCYVGNVPPEDAGLPPGCDPQRAIAVKR